MAETKQQIIESIFDALAIGFDKIPLLNKIKNWRSIIFSLCLVAVAFLHKYGVLTDPTILKYLYIGFTSLIAAALNAKGRTQ